MNLDFVVPESYGGLAIRIVYNPVEDAHEVYVVALDREGRTTHIAEPLVLKPWNRAAPVSPTFRVAAIESGRLAADVMASLSHAGVKPESEAKLAGVLEATREHLADLRKLVERYTEVAMSPRFIVAPPDLPGSHG